IRAASICSLSPAIRSFSISRTRSASTASRARIRAAARGSTCRSSRAGVAAGVDGLFIEAHPNPPEALCDAASQYELDKLADFVKPLLEIHDLVRPHVSHAH